MLKVQKTPSLISLPRNDYNIPGAEWSTVQRVQADWRFAFPLQHYINRRVGEELPQHSLPLHCCAIKKFNHSRSFLHCALKRALHHLRLTSSNGLASSNCRKSIKMARVRSTTRVSREREEAEVTETTPILEVMERSGLVVTEGAIEEGAHVPKLNTLLLKKKMLMKVNITVF
jgi:hypothetical protein